MTEARDNSSLPLLLGITGAVLAVVVGGWFLLYRQDTAVNVDVDADTTGGMASIEEAPGPGTDSDSIKESAVDMSKAAAPNVDAELAKARLAADADILVLPASRSALYYYGRILEANPRHAVAAAEMDAILVRIAQLIATHLEMEEYHEAYEIAALVARYRPDHDLVFETQRVIDDHTEQLVEQAIRDAQAGNDGQAAEALAAAEALPGRNPKYFAAIHDSIDEISEVREAAERGRARRATLAESQARAAWAESVRAAIERGNLLNPAGASARDLLAENNDWDDERKRLTDEFVAALLDAANAAIGDKELTDAQTILAEVDRIDPDAEGIADARGNLNNALIEERSNQVVGTGELTYVKTVPPRYPVRAAQREITGWVIIDFTVTPEGNTANIAVREAEPEKVFDRAAVNAVEQWLFEPIEYRGQIISQRAATKLVFALE
jgi:TonB family protein